MTDLDRTGEHPTFSTDDTVRPTSPEPSRVEGNGRGGWLSQAGFGRSNNRGDAPSRNENSSRHTPSGPLRGRPAASTTTPEAPGASSLGLPAQADRSSREDSRVPTSPSSAREETVEILAIPTQAAPSEPPQQRTGTWPARPAPDDAAAEVWALVERAQAGDSQAFGLIYDRYVDTVFRFIYFRVGNRPLAEDLTADTFLRALKRISSFTWQGRDLGAWLVTIARNLVADHFKSGRYRLEVTTGDVLDADTADRGPEGSPESAVLDHITNVALLTAVKQLNPEQQECIVLRFLHGFSVAETAQAMGKNEGAIKALQYRAVRALHRLLPDGMRP